MTVISSRPAPLPGPVSVVIPTYDERENLSALVPRVLALGERYGAIVVDDNSPDGTGEVADALAAAYPGRVRVLHRARKEGIGPAYVAGFRAALAGDAAFVAEMDADHSHDPADLPRLLAAVEDGGFDLALGSRYVPGGRTEGWPLHRRLISRWGGRYARTVLGIPVADPTGGFKVFARASLAALDLDAIRSDGYGFQIETTYRVLRRGGRVAELPITFTDRVAGASKLSRRIVLEAVVVVWRLRFERRRGVATPVGAHGNAPGFAGNDVPGSPGRPGTAADDRAVGRKDGIDHNRAARPTPTLSPTPDLPPPPSPP